MRLFVTLVVHNFIGIPEPFSCYGINSFFINPDGGFTHVAEKLPLWGCHVALEIQEEK